MRAGAGFPTRHQLLSGNERKISGGHAGRRAEAGTGVLAAAPAMTIGHRPHEPPMDLVANATARARAFEHSDLHSSTPRLRYLLSGETGGSQLGGGHDRVD